MAAAITNDSGRTWREGAKLGLIIGTAIWLWLAIVDATFGRPFHSFEVLGGVAIFTIAHYTHRHLWNRDHVGHSWRTPHA